MKNGQRDGYGEMYWTDNAVFKGTWKMDQRVEGTMTYPDGAVYQGQFMLGLSNGHGKMTFPDGKEFRGEFLNDLPWSGTHFEDGKKVERIKKGEVYTGCC